MPYSTKARRTRCCRSHGDIRSYPLRDMGYEQIHFMRDVKMVVDVVNLGGADWSRTCHLINDIRTKLQELSHWKLSYVSREMNRPAHELARMGTKQFMDKVDKSIAAMCKKLQKNLTSEELLPSLWDKCKEEFLDKYESFAQLVAKIYPSEIIPSAAEMSDLLAPYSGPPKAQNGLSEMKSTTEVKHSITSLICESLKESISNL
ncbi:hypothetical protein FH972_002225 [Carpinus fangiana]|uniref:RNase H type-1 domain-containing protein n=1 Tax=Carpinus fangiana TaxID=176857 RepID=A0A5N6QEK3_9ROSI|nr:hypothetical protein FH972_002225 [Carpinus fangiana]